jgi:ribosomal protein L15
MGDLLIDCVEFDGSLFSTILGKPFPFLTPQHKSNPTPFLSYFGKVGMRHFHITNNLYWRPAINLDRLWTLVPAEEKKGLKENSDVVPVINTLEHGYAKVLGRGA